MQCIDFGVVIMIFIVVVVVVVVITIAVVIMILMIVIIVVIVICIISTVILGKNCWVMDAPGMSSLGLRARTVSKWQAVSFSQLLRVLERTRRTCGGWMRQRG